MRRTLAAGAMPRPDIPLLLVALGTLAICLTYAYQFIAVTPYSGLEHDSSWGVLEIDEPCLERPDWCAAIEGTLRPGDRMLRIGDITHEEYWKGRTAVPFSGFPPGSRVPILFERDGTQMYTEWTVLGPTGTRPLLRLGLVIPFLPFWIAGAAVLLFLRPRDTRWRLLVAFLFCIAIWWTAGAASATQVLGSVLVLGVMTWVLLPVSWHLHLSLPEPLFPRQGWALALAYGLALVLVILELTRVLPRSAYSVGLMLVVGGSLGLLAVRYAVASSAPVRLMARLLLLGIVLAVLPGLLLWVVPNLMDERGQSVYVVYLPTLAFLLLPFFYAYALFKHRLGDLEFRANKVLSLYSYVLLYTSAFALVFALASRWIDFSVETLAFAIMISTVFVALAVPLRTPYQRLVNRLVYGTEYSSDSILKAFANEIPRANNLTALTRLLTKEVAPSLLVRQSALYQVRDGEPKLLYAEGAPAPEGIDAAEALVRFSAGPARYRPPEPKGGGEWDWVRLAVPIQVGTTPVAVWLFGARDPDDFYPLPDIELLQTLGGQVGVALENLRLVESLRKRAYELEVAYQNLEQLDRLKDEFVQNVSHELRTPLTFVKGYSELMLDGAFGELSRVQNEAVEAIADRTQGIIRLVNDIISVQQAKLLQPEREPIQLEALAATALQTAQVVAGRVASEGRTYRFELEAPTDLPMISGDRRRLGQVLDNLLENAIKFTPSGGTITLGLRPTTYAFPAQECEGEPIHAVEITVKDSGIGIPDDQLARIWDRFYQVDGSRTRRYGGMGLGLAIVRSIVEAHGGVTWASSANGQGTTFHVVLPAVAERPEARVFVVAEGVV